MYLNVLYMHNYASLPVNVNDFETNFNVEIVFSLFLYQYREEIKFVILIYYNHAIILRNKNKQYIGQKNKKSLCCVIYFNS